MELMLKSNSSLSAGAVKAFERNVKKKSNNKFCYYLFTHVIFYLSKKNPSGRLKKQKTDKFLPPAIRIILILFFIQINEQKNLFVLLKNVNPLFIHMDVVVVISKFNLMLFS